MKRLNPNFHYIAFGFTCLYAIVVFFQLFGEQGHFSSDLPMHVQFVTSPENHDAAGYSLLHVATARIIPVFIGSGMETPFAIQGVFLVLLVAAFYVSLITVHDFLLNRAPDHLSKWAGPVTSGLFLVSMIVLPFQEGHLYLGFWTPNPWHNPTYSLARVFSIFAVISVIRLLAAPTSWLRFSTLVITATLSMWAKPSFMMTLIPALGILLLLGLIQKSINWNSALKVSLAFVPAVLVLFTIRQMLYAGDDSTNQVIIAPGNAWGIYSSNIGLAVLGGLAFPLFVVAVRVKKLSRFLSLSLLNWAFGFGILYGLAESGDRLGHVNFCWGYMGGMFFLFLAAAEEWFLREPEPKTYLRLTGHVLFFGHLASGIYYFSNILVGRNYF